MKVLIADDDTDRAGRLALTLGADPALHVVRVQAGQSLAEAVAAHAPDVVLVDMGRPDRDALEGLRQVSASHPRPIALFVDQDDPAFMEDAIRAGVSSYNVAGLALPDVKPVLRAAAALFRHHQTTQLDLQRSQLRLHDRDTVDRAKSILIRKQAMTEPEAYRWLQRQAMAGGRRIVDVATGLVRAQEEGTP